MLSLPKVSIATQTESHEVQLEEERQYEMRKLPSHLQESRAEAKAPNVPTLMWKVLSAKEPSKRIEKAPGHGMAIGRHAPRWIWGCAYVNGVRKQVQWDPANLRVGSKVGVLVTKEGDLTIFVDEMEVAQALPCHGHPRHLHLSQTASSPHV